MYRIIEADVLDYLQNADDEKYHAVLCDPPYGLEFMGQAWDSYSPQEYQAWVTQWAEMLLDFVYPGAVLMAFGGTRTYHRLICGLEDAGWEIADSIIAWMYGNGFPKNYDHEKGFRRLRHGGSLGAIGNKAMLNLSLQERLIYFKAEQQYEGFGSSLKPAYEPIVICRAPRTGLTYADCALQFGSGALNIDGGRIEYQSNTDYHNAKGGDIGSTKRGQFLNSLKARPQSQNITPSGRWPANTILCHHPDCTDDHCVEACHVRIVGEQSGELTSGDSLPHHRSNGKSQIGAFDIRDRTGEYKPTYGDTGTAARYFYQAKSPKWEREAGLDAMPLQKAAAMQGNLIDGQRLSGKGEPINAPIRRNPHPTLKPIQLTQYLATLLKPPLDKSRLLVPFAGSGSEMIGAMLAGWSEIVGIEMTPTYIPIAQARLDWWSQFETYDQAKARYDSLNEAQKFHAEQKEAGQLSLFE